MVLSNTSVHQALDNGSLVLTPEPSPRFPAEEGECPYQTSSVDLRLGPEISYFESGMPLVIDLMKGNFAEFFGRNSITREIAEEQPFVLKPNRLVLGRTLERIELPIREGVQCLAARVEGRSSYARCGLLVHCTAPTIHAGFKGSVTLEFINFGPFDIRLTPGAPICQLILETVDGQPFRNDSQFHGQMWPGGAL